MLRRNREFEDEQAIVGSGAGGVRPRRAGPRAGNHHRIPRRPDRRPAGPAAARRHRHDHLDGGAALRRHRRQGRFFVAFLTPGIYAVRAELSGFAPVEKPRVELRLGQRAELNLALTVGGLAETVQVTGNTGVVDVTNTTVGANLDSEMLARLPRPASAG